MNVEPEHLFSNSDMFNVCEGFKEHLKIQLSEIPSSDFVASDEDLLALAMSSINLNVPTLDTNVTYSEKDVEIDVSHDQRRMIFYKGVPLCIPGKEIAIHVPFTGNDYFFRVRPNSYNPNPPQAYVGREELQLIYKVPHDRLVDISADYKELLSKIESNLVLLKSSVDLLVPELLSLGIA